MSWSSGIITTGAFVALALNPKYPCALLKAFDDLVTFLSFGIHVTGPLYPSVNVIACGKFLSSNTVPSLAYVFPVVVILSTPVDFKNLTSILSSGRSSTLGEVGSVGSTVTMWSLTINICFGTSIEEPSANATFNFPSNFPGLLESLSGFSVSVIIASFSSAATLSLFASVVAFTPFDQSI